MDPDLEFGVDEPAPVLVRGIGLGRQPWALGGPGGPPHREPHPGTFTSARVRRRGRPPRRAEPAAEDAPPER